MILKRPLFHLQAVTAGAMPDLSASTGGAAGKVAELGPSRVRSTRPVVSESMEAARFTDLLKKSAEVRFMARGK